MIKMLSLNVRGIRDNDKRRGLFRWLKKYHNANDCFILLQETHSTENVERIWMNEWGSDIYFCHGTNNSHGVAIIPPSSVEVEIKNIQKDENGRILLLNTLVEKENICIVNVYAPATNNVKEKVANTRKFIEMIDNEESVEHMICGGDFNLHLNPNLDKMNSEHENNKRDSDYVNHIKSFCESHNMIDIWRILNPTSQRYTWRQTNPLRQSRLDYWFTSIHMLYNVTDCSIKPSYRSDHSLITLTLETNPTEKRGPGLWKFNSGLLRDEVYVGYIKGVIDQYKTIYHDVENKGVKWDLIKMEIRTATIAYAKTQARMRRDYSIDLLKDINTVESKLSTNPSDELVEQYNSLKSEFERLESIKTKGTMLRSKAKWIEDGEKNTKYFINLEKRNYKAKHITKIICDNQEITDGKHILQSEQTYYSTLYKSKQDKLIANDIFSNRTDLPILNETERESCDTEISLDECGKALNDLHNGKSPGSDGFTTEFYKFFWTDIKDLVFESFTYAFINGTLSIDQRRSILTLIPKKDKDLRFWKNWRPISLLNTDYKIITKLFAKRLKPVLQNIIHPDQVAYIKGRYIGQNIRLMSDVIAFVENNDEECILSCIDFEKAFDTVEWSFIHKALNNFGFGEYFRKWIQIFYTNISAGAMNNGYCTEFFSVTRGIRQGCPISAYLFIIAAEILATEIRNNNSICGVTIKGKEIKIMQMADDTTIFVKDFVSLHRVLLIFELFSQMTGLRINKSKTEALKLGKYKDYKKTPFGIKWNKNNIYSLGIKHYLSDKETMRANFNDRLNSIRKTMYIWMQRDLSLKGKVTVLKSLIMPQILYVSTNLPVPEFFVKEVNTLMFKFLWDGKPDKIKRSVVIRKIEDGGLKMPHVESQIKAQKIMWVKRLLENDDASWKEYSKWLLGEITPADFLTCTYDKKQIKGVPLFYHQLFYAWSELREEEKIDSVWAVRRQFLYFNKFIQINGKYLSKRYNIWYKAGIKRIHDIVDQRGNFCTIEQLQEEYGIIIDVMLYNSLKSSIPKEWKHKLKEITIVKDAIPPGEPIILNINDTEIPCQFITNNMIYWIFVQKISSNPTAITTWKNDFQDENIPWQKIFTLPYNITRETKLQSFQYKIVHRIFPCNSWVSRWKPDVTEICNFCNGIDNLQHYFWECEIVKPFWNSCTVWWNRNISCQINLTGKDVILGSFCPGKHNISFNFLILHGKWYIARQKYLFKKIDFYTFLTELKMALLLENYISHNQKKVKVFEERYGELYEALTY